MKESDRAMEWVVRKRKSTELLQVSGGNENFNTSEGKSVVSDSEVLVLFVTPDS
jgi:hypothetical protein